MIDGLLPKLWATGTLLTLCAFALTMLQSLLQLPDNETALVIGIRFAILLMILVVGGALAIVWSL